MCADAHSLYGPFDAKTDKEKCAWEASCIAEKRQCTVMELAHRLRTERERRNLQQADVAAAVGVVRATITQWESGSKVPGRRHVETLAAFYKVSLDDLMGRSGGSDEIKGKTPEEEVVLLMRRASPHVQDAVLTLLRSSVPPIE